MPPAGVVNVQEVRFLAPPAASLGLTPFWGTLSHLGKGSMLAFLGQPKVSFVERELFIAEESRWLRNSELWLGHKEQLFGQTELFLAG